MNFDDIYVGEEYIGSGLLGIYGKGGFYLKSKINGADKTIMQYVGLSGQDKLWVNSNDFEFRYGKCITLTQTSDGRFKKDVQPLSSSLLQLSKLRGVSYLQDFSEHPRYGKDKKMIVDGYEIAFEPLTDDSSRHTGFIAQELQEVFPDLVKTDEDSCLSVNYIGLIPVIVEALKEQQAIITAQSGKITELQTEVNALREGKTPPQAKGIEAQNAFLYQNAPNPFNAATTIRYFLGEETSNAAIYIFDMQGKLIETRPVTGAGEGAIEISASGLQPGMYLYSLLVNNQEVDTKRMVITE